MPNKIIVEFQPQNHEQLISALERVNVATQKINKRQQKFSSSAANLTAKLKAQSVTWKQLGVSTETLKKGYKGNRLALEKMRLAMKQTTKAGGGMLRNQRLLHGSLATLRSQLLLVNFAMAMGVRQIIKFGKEAAQLDAMSRAFTTLSGGSENASVSIEKLGKATNGTMSDFDLFQQANNAMILGVSNNSDEMADMFDMAQRLGSALGRDTRSSVESLITGIGRQSRLMLDNIGIIVKADKAYQDYAIANNKLASQLTDSEKKQAFMNAALDAARDKVAQLPEEILTADQKFQQFGASIDNLQKRIGTALMPVLESMAELLTDLADAFDTDRIQAYAFTITGGLVIGMIAYIAQCKKAVLWQTRLGWGALATAAGLLAAELLVLSGIFKDVEDPMDKVGESAEVWFKRMSKLGKLDLEAELDLLQSGLGPTSQAFTDAEAEVIKLEKAITNLRATKPINRAAFGQMRAYNQAMSDLRDKLKLANAALWALDEPVDNTSQIIQDMIDVIDVGFTSWENYIESGEKAVLMHQKTHEGQLAVIDGNIAMIQSLIDVEGASTQYTEIMAMLTQQRIDLIDKESKKEQEAFKTKLKVWSSTIGAIGDVVGMSKGQAKAAAAIQAAAAVVDAWSAALSTKAQVAKYMLPPAPQIAFGASLVSGLVAARQIAMSANEIGSGGSSGAAGQAFQEGGYVGGRRHSQGGTIIEAEQGEFVMSRNAVESIGIETLNRMNLEGGGGGVNITVTGNVLTQDYVEGELAESIKEALRRGSDFGIS